jgi:mRNA interferase RelE/StbE
MKSIFRKSFTRDLKKIKDQGVLQRVRQVLDQVEAAAEPQGLRDCKKLSGSENFYRLRAGEYRIGVIIEGDAVEFIRCLSRRDLYRIFP